ncbi:TMEFF2 [Branchiostoma lanceolatum]|uniref:TMEFF2 protein n=1 Tax=Branchiostoma lanceolatum TaxID=7740 RepID=A0A8K0A119_BRALA|nr:TMEFF2 [Branchiostoma lanceolatum]
MWPMSQLFYLCATASVAFSKIPVQVNVVATEGNAIIEEITTENATTPTTPTSGHSHYVECPASFDGYCLHGGTCLYLPEHPDPHQRPLCRCTPDYAGNRCQVGNILSRRGMAVGPGRTTNHVVTIAAVSGVLSVVVLLGAAYLGWRLYRRRAGYDVRTNGESGDKAGYGSTAALN